LIQGIEVRRLRLRQAGNARESQARTLVAEGDFKRVAVEKAEVEVEKAGSTPRCRADRRRSIMKGGFGLSWRRRLSALEKACSDQGGFRSSSRFRSRSLRHRGKGRRETDVAKPWRHDCPGAEERHLLVSNFYNWGPEEPELQPGDTVWSAIVAQIPTPEMEVGPLSEVDHQPSPGMKARCILDTYPDRSSTASQWGRWLRAAVASGGGTPAGFAVVSLARADPVMRPGLRSGQWCVGLAEGLAVPRQRSGSKDGPIVKKGLTGSSMSRHGLQCRRCGGVGARGGPCPPSDSARPWRRSPVASWVGLAGVLLAAPAFVAPGPE
jgi:hypothetical protein